MKVCVAGLWHLGSVTAACLADSGCDVTGLDEAGETVEALNRGQAPLYEPGLDELIRKGIEAGLLRFTTNAGEAVKSASVLWIAFDTPVSEDDRADVNHVVSRVEKLFPLLEPGTLVVVSSQLPVGSVAALERRCGRQDISFAALPENLRLGKAIEVFSKPDRVVAGVRGDSDRARIATLLAPLTDRIEWMSVESAEMTKHAINAFLATSVVFINEIATICEEVGADAKEVERGLKSESRIGPRAYLSPGAAFAGGTLARDIAFLGEVSKKAGRPSPLIASVKTSNDLHKGWTRHKLQTLLGDLRHRTVGVWGLTYKPGTDTLRRSGAVELCRWLHQQGARVVAHDPAVKALPQELQSIIELQGSPAAAASNVDALVVATEWPVYREVDLDIRGTLTVVDANRFLRDKFEGHAAVRYVTIGKGSA
ncbi:MAG: nucleotide sugar dehydrogenase [Polyangia bacterium]|jgi:UDPglucose 6-dehydrogenase